jgi:CHASE2 domain-containing sensor protein
MHGGGMIPMRQALRQMRYAKPWQQTLLAVGLVVLGAVLVIAGAWLGLLPLLLGVLFGVRFLRLRMDARRAAK